MTQPPLTSVVRLPALGSSSGQARRFVTSTLRTVGLDHLEDAGAVAVSELVTNAVLHARTEVDVTVSIDAAQVRVAVGDGNPDLPVVRSYGRTATTGRGLALVAALVDDLGVQSRDEGKTVWFTLSRATTGSEPAAAPDLAGLWDADLTDDAAAGGRAPVAVLCDLPVDLWAISHRHHDAALRELVLHRGNRIPETTQAWAWYAAADSAHHLLSAAVERALAAAAEAEPGAVTVEVPLEPDLPERLAELARALDDADALSLRGSLLAPPAPPRVVALRRWCLGQVVAQAGGAAPVPWRGAATGDSGPRTGT